MNVLEEAAGLVGGARQEAYGHPTVNHARTALLWDAYLEARKLSPSGVTVESIIKFPPGMASGECEQWAQAFRESTPRRSLTPADVCWLNILQKLARDMHEPRRDNLVDAAGYLLNIEMLGGHG